MYSFSSRVRYSETDSEGKLTLAALLDFFQDSSLFHSEDIGFGLGYLKEHSLGWVLNSWQVEIDRYPEFGENIVVGTFPYKFKGFLGFRNFFLQDESGSMTVKANSIWTLMDTDKMRPARPPEEMLKGYILSDKLEMEYGSRKIEPVGEEITGEPILVKEHHLDTNQHVNNGQYVKMAIDFLLDGDKEDKFQRFSVKRLRAEYKKSAVLHDVIIPHFYDGGKVVTVSLCNQAAEVFANIEFQLQK